MSETPLWAAYLEMTLGEGANRARQQWILLPPVPVPVAAPFGMTPVPHPAYFHRLQSKPDHRTAWRVFHLNSDSKERALVDSIASAESRGWVARPMVTCQVHPQEMADIVRSGWKTPYRVLERCGRVSRIMHGYTI